MSETSSFVKEESLARPTGALRLNLRLFGALPAFLKLLPLSLLTIILSSVAPSAFRWYSGNLLNDSAPMPIAGTGLDLRFTLRGLVLLTAFAMFFRILAWALFEISGMWSSQRIHGAMVRAMMRTRTTFFDENPSGRLINRLIRDYDEVRSTAIIFVGDFLNAAVEIVSIAGVACFASPWAGLLVLPLLGVFTYIQTQRSEMLDHARALSAVATSRVIGRKTDLIEGREIFLLYGRADQLLERMVESFREYVQATALSVRIETWASFWIRVSAEVFSFVVLVLLAFALHRGEVGLALAGVIISSLFGITGSIGWLDFATSLISRSTPHVRRVFEFVDLPPEEREEGSVPAPGLSSPGPLRGEIRFQGFTMSYRKDTPVILSNLDLVIPWGGKTALIGRTGSGKTSLVQALLRMVHVHGGDILIGGRSIFSVEVHELRRLFGVVPQAPYLFAGTVRSNLDRVGELKDEALSRALEGVGLGYSLDHPVSEGGQNLSLGERQLLCLARVIAADRQIILMDEPTSGLDPQTDARISQIFRTAFRNKTVLTIAHRRESLGTYDQVVEMSAGRVDLIRTNR